MSSRGVVVSQVHRRNDTHSCVRDFATPLPNLDHLEGSLVCIPVGWFVTPAMRDWVVQCVREFDTMLRKDGGVEEGMARPPSKL